MKGSLLIASILLISGCVGTVKLAKENGVKTKDSAIPVTTKGTMAEPTK